MLSNIANKCITFFSEKWRSRWQIQTENPSQTTDTHLTPTFNHDGCQWRPFRDNKQKMESQPLRSALKYRICLSLLNTFNGHHSCLEPPLINSTTDSEMTAREPDMTGNGERFLLPRHFQVGELLNFCRQLWAYWINWFSADLLCPLLWCGEFLMI